MKNPIIGRSVIGPDFIGRKDQINSILKDLKHSDILIQGARRFGKTSIMKEIQSRLQNQGFQCVYGDFETIKSEYDFYFKLLVLIESSNKW
ncbi:MAG TPA: ATP-binding protein, partial [Methanospirillum sp.]|nr:ATP-binding protein [Methanospirillum sp.]